MKFRLQQTAYIYRKSVSINICFYYIKDYAPALSAIREAAGRPDGEMFCYTDNGYFIPDVTVSRRAFTNIGQAVCGKIHGIFRDESSDRRIDYL